MLATPHDALFKATFSDLARAAEELRHVFAPEIVRRMDLSTLALQPGSWVDGRLRQRHADMLYSVCFAGRRALVHVLLEHESSCDPWMPLWLLVYVVRIWESLLQRGELASGRLPVILPVVVHHGEKGWQSSTRFEALIDLPGDAPEAIWAYVPRFRFALDDLTATSSEALRRRAASAGTRLVLAALKEVRTIADRVQLIRGLAGLLREVQREADGARALRLVFRYIAEVRGADDRIIDIIATEVGPKEADTMLTMAEGWREEGRQEGRQEGQRKILLRLLRRRFGDVPAAVLARVERADEASLERWSEEVLDAPSLDALFPSV